MSTSTHRTIALALFLLLGPILAPARAQPPAALSEWARAHHCETRLLWLDATANLERLDTRAGVCRILDKCVAAHINTVGVGVKTPCGFSLYDSRIVPRLRTFLGRIHYPPNYDLLKTVIEEGHKRGLEVVALVMVFSEGRKLDRSGPVYTRFPQWQCVAYRPSGHGGALVPGSSFGGDTFVFVNPALPAVQSYELSVLREIATNYDVDGICIDRCRYPALWADFSPASHAAFEHYLGHAVRRWPQEVFTYVGGSVHPGPLYRRWLEWRARVIGGFVRRAAHVVHAARPSCLFGSAVGSWYPDYSPEGVNWGSPRFNPSAEWPWATPGYRAAGYADAVDYIIPSCYSPSITTDEALKKGQPWYRSVQGGAQMAREAVANACWVYGDVYAEDFRGHPNRFRQALETVSQETNGVMIFDVSQIEEYGWWPIIREVLKGHTLPPHRRVLLARHLLSITLATRTPRSAASKG